MQIIPVIDIRGGVVVHAKGGIREHYQPLVSQITDSCDPMRVIEDLLKWHAFSCVYIADLDGIEKQLYRYDLYQALTARFADLQIWLDAGIADEVELNKWLQKVSVRPVVGSETLKDCSLISRLALQAQVILSLDFRQGQLVGQSSLLSEPTLWPNSVIAMSLDSVGAASGPDVAIVDLLRQKRKDVSLFAAGGVSNKKDLELLQQQGVDGALIASAIHNGQLSAAEVAAFN